jgi:hypothetical protein
MTPFERLKLLTGAQCAALPSATQKRTSPQELLALVTRLKSLTL